MSKEREIKLSQETPDKNRSHALRKNGLGRSFVTAIIFVGLSVGAACGGSAQLPKEGDGLERVGNRLIDKTLILGDGDRTIEGIEFWFDENYVPGTAGGSLAMQICFGKEGLFRIISKEEEPNPGWLVDVEYPHKTECVVKHPVTELAKGDKEEVLLGVGNTSKETYHDMRDYKVERTNQGLNGKYNGKKDINPSEIQLRDKSNGSK